MEGGGKMGGGKLHDHSPSQEGTETKGEGNRN